MVTDTNWRTFKRSSNALALVLCVFAAPSQVGCMEQPQRPQPPVEHAIGGKTAEDVFKEPHLVALTRAACIGDTETIEREVDAGTNPNTKGLDGVTPLIWAVNCENLPGLESLLKAGADPNEYIPDVGPPVGIATGMNNPALLSLLLRYGGSPDAAYNDDMWTALRIAFVLGAKKEGWGNYYILLNAGANINLPHRGDTIAEFAAMMNHFDKVAELLDRGYSYDLDRLARFVAVTNVPILTKEQQRWHAVVQTKLKSRGV